MSLALYRKYRPATFAELKGQEHVAEPLQQALRNGRINHAYLFSGPRGCGKTSSARILARSLNCELGPTPDPCGKCDSCVALGPGGNGHIDVIEIDAASHGGVDDARDLRERAFFAPVSARFKVYIIDEAHMVSREGFNALLKLVEEPPPHLKFVFATTEPEKVIGTIRSRTHHYPFRLVPPGTLRELVEEILQAEQIPYEPTALPLVVRAGAGSARDTLSILDQLLAGANEAGITYARAVSLLGYTDASLLDEVVDAFAARDGAAVFAAIDRVLESGQDPRRFAADLLERFRDLVILSNVPEAATSGLLDAPSDEMEQLQRQVAGMGAAELTRAADLLHTGLTEMRGATSPRLLLELICARILLPTAYEDESSMLARLERLERRVALATNTPSHAPLTPTPTPTPTSPRTEAPPARGANPTSSVNRAGGAVEVEQHSVDNPRGSTGSPAAYRAGSTEPAGPQSGQTAPYPPGQPTPGGATPGHTTPGHAGSGQAGSGQAGSSHAGSGHAGPGHAGPGQAGSSHAGSGHAGPGEVEPGHAGPGHAGPGHAGPGHAGPGHAGLGGASAGSALPGGATSGVSGDATSGHGTAGGGAAGYEGTSGARSRSAQEEAARGTAGGSAQGFSEGGGRGSGPGARGARSGDAASGAGATSGAGGGAGQYAAAQGSAASPEGAGGGSGPGLGLDAAAVRRVWPDVLEGVKQRSRVAWMTVMSGVHVASVEGNLMTLAFEAEGTRKNFTHGRRDVVLKDVLKQFLGVDLRIETVLSGGGPAPRTERQVQSFAPQAPPPAAPPQVPGPSAPADSRGASAPRTSRPSGPAARQQADPPPSPPPDDVPPPPEAPPAYDESDEVDPEGDADADGTEAEVSGMALIQRELGGQIIREIDNS
jgi:DNA polymerase III subunit gamma/tau